MSPTIVQQTNLVNYAWGLAIGYVTGESVAGEKRDAQHPLMGQPAGRAPPVIPPLSSTRSSFISIINPVIHNALVHFRIYPRPPRQSFALLARCRST